jgi:hypothetical protein
MQLSDKISGVIATFVKMIVQRTLFGTSTSSLAWGGKLLTVVACLVAGTDPGMADFGFLQDVARRLEGWPKGRWVAGSCKK